MQEASFRERWKSLKWNLSLNSFEYTIFICPNKQYQTFTLGDGGMDFANHLNAFGIPRSTGDSCFQDNELHSMGLLWPLERTLSGCTQARVSGGSQVKSQSPYEKWDTLTAVWEENCVETLSSVKTGGWWQKTVRIFFPWSFLLGNQRNGLLGYSFFFFLLILWCWVRAHNCNWQVTGSL